MLLFASMGWGTWSRPENAGTELGKLAELEKPFREQRAKQNAGGFQAGDVESIFEVQKVADMKTAIEGVVRNLGRVEMSRSQFEALVDLAFNAGVKGMKESAAFKSLERNKSFEAADLMKTARVKANSANGLKDRRKRASALMRQDCIGYVQIPIY